MTDFTITSGFATYSRVRQPAPYESQTPSIHLNFEMAEGADPEKVTAKVMLMAKNAVEGAFHDLASAQPGSTETAQPQPRRTVSRKGSAVSQPHGDVPPDTAQPTASVEAKEPTGADTNPLEALQGTTQEPSTPTAEVEPVDDLAALSGKAVPALTEQDVVTALQKASAYLRGPKGPGHINDLVKLLAAFGVKGYEELKPEQYAEFIDKVKAVAHHD